MTVIDTFSKRQKRLSGKPTDVFIYDEIPDALRVQICRIWLNCFGFSRADYVGINPAYKYLHIELAAEFGLFSFSHSNESHDDALVNFFSQQASTEQALDMIDVSFRYALSKTDDVYWKASYSVKISGKEAIQDLNTRFLEHAVGYVFVDGQDPKLIRRDNDHLHKEAVMPALRLLHEEQFSGANAEYRTAHEHYRHGAYKECLNECLKAFESTLKTICTRMKWPYKETDTASGLIDACLKNDLLPVFMQAHLGALKSLLETAIPTVRNKLGGHGQGAEVKEVPSFYAEYLLHETAATIVFLVDAYKKIR